MKKKYGLLKAVAITLSVTFVCLFLGFLYAWNVEDVLTGEAEMHLEEVAVQGARLVKKQMDKDFDVLHILANGQISDPKVPLEKKMARLKQEGDAHGFFRIGYVDPDGNALTTDGHEFSVADRDFFRHSIKGEDYISRPVLDKVYQELYGIVFSIPLYSGEEWTGVLFGGYEVGVLTDLINVTFYRDNGFAYITDSDGNILLHPQTEKRAKNIFEIARAENDAAMLASFRTALKTGETGAMRLLIGGEDRYLGYARIPGDSDWRLVSSVPSAVVFNRSDQLIRISLLYVGAVAVILLGVTIYILAYQRRSGSKLMRMAYTDPLTGARNLGKFRMDAAELLRHKGAENYALVCVDVNRFKTINQDFGFSAGDAVLRHIADVLAAELSPEELYGRISADHFVLLTLRTGSREDYMARMDALRLRLRDCRLPAAEGRPFSLNCGIYEASAGEEDVNAMIDKANVARKSVKNGMEDAFAFYDARLHDALQKEKEIEGSMERALENREFVPYFQPKYDLATGRVVGAEALARWVSPSKGIIPPDDFIPLFEKNGFITKLDFYMLEEVCRRLRGWMDAGREPPPVAVNQSRLYMYNAEYIENCGAILKKYGISPSMIELELTESAVYQNIDVLIDVMKRLHEAGFRLAMDDFGSGYSSLNMLKDLDVDVLKLDRLFFSETSGSARGRTVISNIIAMAKELDIHVVAEGVETAEQVRFLRSIRCDVAQGYYYARPLPPADFETLIKNEQ